MDRRSHLGQMIIELGWLEEKQLNEILIEARRTRQPLGVVLRELGHITEKEMNNLVQAQSLIRDGYISVREAANALNVCSWTGVPLERALAMSGMLPKEGISYSKRLGQLLVTSGCIDNK